MIKVGITGQSGFVGTHLQNTLGLYPGEFERVPFEDDYFADVEQAAFNPANIVPGIGFSPDKMLQGRLFSYGDAQRYRLSVNHYQIPVNQSR